MEDVILSWFDLALANITYDESVSEILPQTWREVEVMLVK